MTINKLYYSNTVICSKGMDKQIAFITFDLLIYDVNFSAEVMR